MNEVRTQKCVGCRCWVLVSFLGEGLLRVARLRLAVGIQLSVNDVLLVLLSNRLNGSGRRLDQRNWCSLRRQC